MHSNARTTIWIATMMALIVSAWCSGAKVTSPMRLLASSPNHALLCAPIEILPDSHSGVTTVTLHVRPQRVALDAPHVTSAASIEGIAFTSRVFTWDHSTPSTNVAGVMNERSPLCGGVMPGPTLVVAPGGVLNVTIVNHLEKPRMKAATHSYGEEEEDEHFLQQGGNPGPVNENYARNHWHHVNVTNLHTHGLHVNPSVDDPFRKVAPGGGVGSYWITLPASHPTGTYWYHTHVHGATALHLMGGLFGVILVEEDIIIQRKQQQIPNPKQHSRAAKQSAAGGGGSPPSVVPAHGGTVRAQLLRAAIPRYTVAVHLLKFAKKGAPSPFSGWSFADLDERLHSSLSTNSTVNGVDFLAVNGQLQPVLDVIEGRPVLLHFLFASSFGELDLEFPPECDALVVAADGVDYSTPRPLGATTGSAEPRAISKASAHAKPPKREKGGGRIKLVSATRLDVVVTCSIKAPRKKKQSGDPTTIALLSVIDKSVQEFANEEYSEKLRVLGIVQPEVVLQLNVVDTDDTPNQRDEGVSSKALMDMVHHQATMPNPLVSPLPELRWMPVNKSWELSMDQRSQVKYNHAHLGKDLAAELAVNGRRPAPQPSATVYAIGSGENCAPHRKGAEKPANSHCLFSPFEGKRGRNVTAYIGFVVPHGGVVESRWYGDPADTRPHPLHVHVNHFQIVGYLSDAEAALDPNQGWNRSMLNHNTITSHESLEALGEYGIQPGDWRDTIPVLPGVTTVRWRASRFHGEIVYHCHTTSHEDLGMMGSYYVLPPVHVAASSPRASEDDEGAPSSSYVEGNDSSGSSRAAHDSSSHERLAPVNIEDYTRNATLRHCWTPLLIALVAVTVFLWYWLRQIALRGVKGPTRVRPTEV
ncbi:multicopper oxidase, putative [Bodo saltans]|uniref:Multicopper oxidase, putative n=1 Tax=Bodo saltans TaxID=75058 RepID=A0A0S4JGF1_BODSA|nr:multicopper oxidase, putative [Bodo saltans]|eukprot:CUG88519.1 multicopper oxidase, putative [Bodo saltans]